MQGTWEYLIFKLIDPARRRENPRLGGGKILESCNGRKKPIIIIESHRVSGFIDPMLLHIGAQ